MILTDLIIVQVWILRFEEWVMVLAVEDESIRWTSHFGFLAGLDLWITSSENDLIVAMIMMGRHYLDQGTIRILENHYWRLDEIPGCEIGQGGRIDVHLRLTGSELQWSQVP